MQTQEQHQAELEQHIREFRLATQGLFGVPPVYLENHVAGVRVTQKSIFPQREARQ